MGYNIAIDGPAGAGKSTIAKMAAKKLVFCDVVRSYVPGYGVLFYDK